MPKTFILSDESLNSYGFRLLTSGCDMSAFQKNPVMLLEHRNWGDDFLGPIGKWDNVRIEAARILAEDSFDMNDEKAKKVADKVENGFIKAASVGFEIIETSTDPTVMLPGQTRPTVTKWKLVEASVCAIPSNENALALYDKSGNTIVLSGTGNQAQLNSILPTIQNPSSMIKLTQKTLALLALTDAATVEGIEAAIEKLHNDYTALKNDREKEIKLRAETFAEKLVTEKKITAAEKPQFVELALKDMATAELVAGKLSAPKLPIGTMKVQGNEPQETKLSWREMEKKDPKGLAKLRKENPEEAAELFKEQYGKYPSWHQAAALLVILLCTLFSFNAGAQHSGGGISYQGKKVEWTFPTDITANEAPLFPSWDFQTDVQIASDTVWIEVTQCNTYASTDTLSGNPVIAADLSDYISEGCQLFVRLYNDTVTWASASFGTVPTSAGLLATGKIKLVHFVYDGSKFQIVSTPLQIN